LSVVESQKEDKATQNTGDNDPERQEPTVIVRDLGIYPFQEFSPLQKAFEWSYLAAEKVVFLKAMHEINRYLTFREL
jgi:hypothetical protein